MCWYVADHWVKQLRDRMVYRPHATGQEQPAEEPISQRVLEGLVALATFLVNETATLENPSTDPKRRKTIYDRIPKEVVTNASSLARDLLWRAKQMLTGSKDVDFEFAETGNDAQIIDEIGKNGLSKKRKKQTNGDGGPSGPKRPRIKNPATR